jgi:NitT/TauT family transport system substrate-binding protein
MRPPLLHAVAVGSPSAATRSRRALGAVAGLAAVLLAAGCTGAGPGAGASANGVSTLTVAAVPDVNDAPLYIAAEQGQFTAEGLKVQIKDYSSARSEIAALRAGTVDVAAGDYVDFFYAQDSNPDMAIVAEGYNAATGVMEVLVRANSDITTPQQLAGTTIGTPEPQEIPYNPSTPYSMETLATQSALQDNGVDPASVTWKPMPAPDLIGALGSGQVSAIVVTEPYIYQAESQIGAAEVLDSLSGTTASLPLSGYFALASFARAHTDVLQKFRAALESVQGGANTGATTRAAMPGYAGVNTETADLITLGDYQTSLNTSSLERVADLLAEFGVIGKPLDVASMLAP